MWKRMPNSISGPTRALDEVLSRLDDENPFPTLTSAKCLHCFSDYSGDHKQSRFETYSFLVCDLEQSTDAIASLQSLRQAEIRDSRRFKFQKLGRDVILDRCVPAFWDAANRTMGVVFIVGVDKGLDTLSRSKHGRDRDPDLARMVDRLPANTRERLQRILHFASLFVAALSSPGQDVLWVTDEDEIAANPERRSNFVDLFRNLASHYLQHDLSGLDAAVLGEVHPTDLAEDLASVPDFLAGAWAEALARRATSFYTLPSGLLVPIDAALSARARRVLDLAGARRQRLRHVPVIIEGTTTPGELRVQYIEYRSAA